MKTLSSVFQELYHNKQWGHQWDLLLLMQKWERAVGETLAEVTIPAYFRKETLCIYVKNSAWMQQLQFLKPDMLEKINQAGLSHQVTDIHWLLQPHKFFRPVATKKTGTPPRLLDAEELRKAKGIVAGIEDEGCRDAFYELWLTVQRNKAED